METAFPSFNPKSRKLGAWGKLKCLGDLAQLARGSGSNPHSPGETFNRAVERNKHSVVHRSRDRHPQATAMCCADRGTRCTEMPLSLSSEASASTVAAVSSVGRIMMTGVGVTRRPGGPCCSSAALKSKEQAGQDFCHFTQFREPIRGPNLVTPQRPQTYCGEIA